MIEQLIQDRLSYETWFVREVEMGLRSAEAEPLMSLDEAEHELNVYMDEQEAKRRG